MIKKIRDVADAVIAGKKCSAEEALLLFDAKGGELNLLFAEAGRIREKFVGNSVTLCSIINAKSGRCPENCSFCAQSSHHKTNAPVYQLVDEDEIVKCARKAEENGSSCYGIITSGTSLKDDEEIEKVCRAVRRIKSETGINPSCSLGIISEESAKKLFDAGVETYHHNLETARSFFPKICSSHSYEEDVETIKRVKNIGFSVCCGGIFGLGESMAQRIELLETLRELDVDSIPINFLDPVAGTPLESANFLTPLEALKIISVARFLLPTKQIKICGGREKNLRELQSMIFYAGASGMMTGNYLTKLGRNPEKDREMIKDLGLEIAECGCKI